MDFISAAEARTRAEQQTQRNLTAKLEEAVAQIHQSISYSCLKTTVVYDDISEGQLKYVRERLHTQGYDTSVSRQGGYTHLLIDWSSTINES